MKKKSAPLESTAKQDAVIYCRVSDPRQADNFSLGTQEEGCKAYCEKLGLRVRATFIERGFSAKTANRPEFARMRDYCREHQGRIGAVVVYKSSRFARSTRDFLNVWSELAEQGIRLHSVTEPHVSEDTPAGKFHLTLMAAFSEMDNSLRTVGVIDGMQEAMRSGAWPFNPPAGYFLVNKLLVPDPKTAPLIAEAFRLYATGSFTPTELWQKMLKAGLRTRKGRPLSRPHFEKILRNDVYAGYVTCKKLGVDRVKGKHEPLIDEATFQRVQAVRTRRYRAKPRRTGPEFLLRGMVKCSECGRVIAASFSRGRHGQRYPYYSCVVCNTRTRVEVLDKEFTEMLHGLQPEPDFVDGLSAALEAVISERTKHAVEQERQLRKKLDALRGKTDALMDGFTSGDVDASEYKRGVARYGTEIKDVEDSIRSVSEAIRAVPSVDKLMPFALRYLSDLPGTWNRMNVQQRRRLIEILYPDGLLFDGTHLRTPAKPCIFKALDGANGGGRLNGGPEEDRTPDLCIANAALSQLSYRPQSDEMLPNTARNCQMNGQRSARTPRRVSLY